MMLLCRAPVKESDKWNEASPFTEGGKLTEFVILRGDGGYENIDTGQDELLKVSNPLFAPNTVPTVGK